MENKNLTVWQRLSHAFGPNAMLNQDVPTYKFDKKELLRTQDKNDFERQRLQAQQTFYLSNQWSKIDNHLYTQAIYYEPSRLASVYDFEAMEYSLFAETKIATPDGFYTIKELADKGRDYEFITYAYDHNLKKVVPAKAYNAHYTRDEMTYKITFDDNSHIIATYGHRFLKRDGVFCEVENLQIGDSMMPFYRKSFYNNQNYNWVYTCNKNEGHHGWVKEDVLMAELNPKELNERTFITSKLIPWDLLVETAKKEKSMRNVSIVLGISIYELISKIQVGGFNDWSTFMEAYGLDVPNEKIESDEVLVNHKIISIEPYGVVPVYDLTVPGYKNFATDTIFSHNTPEIGAALDIYAEESTTTDENGFMLQIYSESKRIKSVLTDLFNNVLDINTNLPMWTRNTTKFGDNFIYLKLDPEKGIVGCNQLPNIEIERLEPGGEDKTVSQSTNKVINDSLKFRWKNKTMEFQPWEVAHFRLLGDDRKLPYGTSILEKARRIWKQLLLAEDAMLIYRTSRAPERRVFKVFVGNMDDNDVEAYVNRVANKFKREQVVDSKTGNVDMRYNQMAVDQDYFVPVRDPSAPSPIETLPGAQNLGDIADIEYIQKKLVTALRIPKSFLGFEEVVGDGKTLSIQDIRFARTINRIQKCMLAELNKIAIVHLFLLGFEDEISNFTLGLTNPSVQSDLLKIDVWKEKIMLYRDAVSDPGSGVAAVSATWAKKHIFGFSDEEIRLDLQQQRIERAVGQELLNTALVIKKTGLFDNIDKLYGEVSGATTGQNAAAAPGEMGSSSMSSGGLDMGGLDMGGLDMGGEESAEGAPPPPPPLPNESPAEPGLAAESKLTNLNILVESNMIDGSSYIPLTKGQNSLGAINDELKKLLNL